jgi:phosphate transport system substrate-binding protein
MFSGVSLAMDSIRVVGSDVLGEPFARALVQFAKDNDVEVQTNFVGTRIGVPDLKERRADVGLFLVPPGETPPVGDGLIHYVVAYHVAVVVVPNASPLTHITLPQLRGIFAQSAGASYSRWGDLNLSGEWSARPISAYALSPQAALAFPLFQRVVLNGVRPKSGLEYSRTFEALGDRLNSSAGGIGITSATHELSNARVLAIATEANAIAHAPTAERVHAGHYPLRMPLYVVFRRESVRTLQPFLKFILSEEVGAALALHHFVNVPLSARHQFVFELEEIR